MFCIENNEKNKSAVILSTEAGVKISGASVEPVVNDGVKTQCYSAKRDLYARSPNGSRLKMTGKALSLSGASSESIISAESKRDPRLIAMQSPRMTEKALSFLRLRGASGAQGISAPASCRKAHKRRFILNQWLLHFANTSLRMTIHTLTLAVVLSTGIVSESWAYTCTWDGTKLTVTGDKNGNETFTGCPDGSNHKSATEVTFGSGITSIGSFTFEKASSLQSVNMPNVTSIGLHAFKETSLTSVNMPNVTSLGKYAFAYNKTLTKIDMPSVTNLGYGVFEAASALESVYMPKASGPGAYWFWEAYSLTDLIISDETNTTNWSDTIFERNIASNVNAKITCLGNLDICKSKLSKFGDSIVQKVQAPTIEQCNKSANYYWSGISCNNKKNGIKCAENFRQMEDWCNKIRWTPAEVAEVLRNDNTNEVTITFRK